MDKFSFNFADKYGPELECHELLPGEYQTHPVEDEQDLEWLDKVLYSPHPTEGMVMPDAEELELRVIYAMTKKSISNMMDTIYSRNWSPANHRSIERFIDGMIKTPIEFDALEVVNSATRTFTAGLQRIKT